MTNKNLTVHYSDDGIALVLPHTGATATAIELPVEQAEQLRDGITRALADYAEHRKLIADVDDSFGA